MRSTLTPASLTPASLTRWRLRHQMLTGGACADPVEVVHRLGAVQSQDYAGASWALALRISPPMTRRAIDDAFDRGAILRTHVLRPTWHFVTPGDIREWLRLTGPRIVASCRSARNNLGIDARTLSRAMSALQRALEGGRSLDREGVRRVLSRARVPCPSTERFAHVMLVAECAGLVCNGPRIGSAHSYALLDERVAPEGAEARSRSRADSVRELARRYYLTHGPATAHDFTMWSGLTLGDARSALGELGDLLDSAELEGVRWWFPRGRPSATRGVVARLIPNFDEYYIGFKHRGPLTARVHASGAKLQQLLGNLILVDGQLVGNWRRVPKARDTGISLSPAVPLLPRERAAVEREVPRLESFLGEALAVRWTA